jgi:hypothetical protein
MARSAVGISAIFASKAVYPSALAAPTFISLTRSCIAAFSSSVNPSYRFVVAVVLLADFGASFRADFLSAIAKHLPALNEFQPLDVRV